MKQACKETLREAYGLSTCCIRGRSLCFTETQKRLDERSNRMSVYFYIVAGEHDQCLIKQRQ